MTGADGGTLSNQPILIVGGGIGGLAASIALAQRGIASRVLERRRQWDEEGAGIQMGPNGTRILAQLGLLERLEPLVGKPGSIIVRELSSGRVLSTLPLGEGIARRHGAPYWTLHRQDLHGVLRDAALSEPRVEVTNGFELAAVDDDGEAVRAIAADGRQVTGSALVGADGLRSHVRAARFGAAAPRYYGKSAVRAVVPVDAAPQVLTARATHLWMGPSAHAVHYPVRAGREIAVVVILDDSEPGESWAQSASRDWLLARATGFADPLKALIAAAPQWRKWGLYTLPVPEALSAGRIALLGDAAHPVLPFLAQGGVLALEDAATLAGAVAAAQGDIGKAFARYAQVRRARAALVAAQSARNGAIYHLSGVMAAARNAALKLVPPAAMMARYDWLYGWRVP